MPLVLILLGVGVLGYLALNKAGKFQPTPDGSLTNPFQIALGTGGALQLHSGSYYVLPVFLDSHGEGWVVAPNDPTIVIPMGLFQPMTPGRGDVLILASRPGATEVNITGTGAPGWIPVIVTS
jgi:hypothetical protein